MKNSKALREIFEAMMGVLFVVGICGLLVGAVVQVMPMMISGIVLMAVTYIVAPIITKQEDKEHGRTNNDTGH